MSAPLLTKPPGRPFVVRIATPHDLLDADRGHAGEPGRVVDEDAHALGQDPRPYDPSGDSVGVPLAGEPAGLKIGGWPPDDVVTLRCVGGRDSVGRWELWCGPFHVAVSTRMRVVVSLAVPRAAFQDGFR